MKYLAMKRADITESVNLLDALREVFECMGDRDGVSDPWLQRRATIPDRVAVEAYISALYTFNMRRRGNRPHQRRRAKSLNRMKKLGGGSRKYYWSVVRCRPTRH